MQSRQTFHGLFTRIIILEVCMESSKMMFCLFIKQKTTYCQFKITIIVKNGINFKLMTILWNDIDNTINDKLNLDRWVTHRTNFCINMFYHARNCPTNAWQIAVKCHICSTNGSPQFIMLLQHHNHTLRPK